MRDRPTRTALHQTHFGHASRPSPCGQHNKPGNRPTPTLWSAVEHNVFRFSTFLAFHFSLFTFHFSLFTFHFSLFTFHFSLFTPAFAGFRLRHFGVPLSRDCFAHAASITNRTAVRLRHFGVSFRTTVIRLLKHSGSRDCGRHCLCRTVRHGRRYTKPILDTPPVPAHASGIINRATARLREFRVPLSTKLLFFQTTPRTWSLVEHNAFSLWVGAYGAFWTTGQHILDNHQPHFGQSPAIGLMRPIGPIGPIVLPLRKHNPDATDVRFRRV